VLLGKIVQVIHSLKRELATLNGRIFRKWSLILIKQVII